MNGTRARGGRTQAKPSCVKITVETTTDPGMPYKLRWRKWGLFWVKPPIATDRGCNIDLEFTLKDKANTGVGFATPARAGFGANAVKDGCPAAGCDAGGEIDFDQSAASKTGLTIRDRNINAGDLQFAVFFDDGSKLDPIIQNTGGGPGTLGIS